MAMKIDFLTNPVFEMLVSMNRIANDDLLENNYFENSGYIPNPRMTAILQAIMGGLSMFYKQEITFFFSKPLSFADGVWRLVIERSLTDIEDIPSAFSALPVEQAQKLMLGEVIGQIYPNEEESCLDIEKIVVNGKLEALLMDSNVLSASDKEKTLELFRYPSETRQRLVHLLEKYIQIFKAYIPELLELDRAESEKSEKACRENPNDFFMNYLKINTSILPPDGSILLIPNCFSEILTYIMEDVGGRCVLVYGCFISKKRLREQLSEERKQLFKILSEEKRVEIIKRLAQQPALGSDLAKQVGLTNATASYHLSMLQGIGIVEYERIGQRLHYILNKGMLEDLLDRAYKDLTHQPIL